MDQKPRYLISLGIEGFKRIEAAFIPLGDQAGVTQITGANGHGKSSVLDAIECLLAGKGALPPDAIHHGAKQARIRGQLGDLIITRNITPGKDGKQESTLTVESADGARYSQPQQILNELLGSFSFDPVAFLRLPEKEKYLALRKFVEGIDFELEERLYKGDFELRTDVNREAKRLRNASTAIFVPEGTPKQRISIERLSKELERAGAANAARERELSAKENLRQKSLSLTAENDRMRAQIAANEITITQTNKDFASMEIPDEIDTAELRRDLTKANETNKAVEAYIQRREHEAMAEAEEKKSAELTAKMEARTARINKAIEATKMPYPSLTLANNMVILAGVPFEQGSYAEKLRAAVGIAMAENPALRTILVHEGSMLDSKAMQIVAEMAIDRDYQVIVERVDESGRIGVCMVEGTVASIDGEPVDLAPETETAKPAKKPRK